MNGLLILLITGSVLNVIWVIAVVQSGSSLKKGKIPDWLDSSSALRVLTPVYYLLLIGTLGLFAVAPLLGGRAAGTICTLPVLLNTCLITFSRPYSEVRTTAEGRALCVVIFSALTITFLPVALIATYYAVE